MDKLAVVILNWNGCEMLRRFLPSVVRFSEADGGVVWVADNASEDTSCEMVKHDFPSVRLICLEKNYGFAEGYNRALAQIEAEYVVLLNSDVEVSEHWLLPMILYMDAHPEVAACQPKLLSYDSRSCFEYAGAAGGFIDRYGYPFCRGRLFGNVEADRGQYDTVQPVFWVSGASLFIRRKDYFEVGGLDGRFFAHMEEIDLCWRLRARGRVLVYIPESVVYHVGGATLKRDNSVKTFLNFRNNLLMLYKNLPEKELSFVMWVRALLDIIAALHFLLQLDFSNAWAVWRARRAFASLKTSFKEARLENLSKAVLFDIPERKSFSLLWQFYVRGKKCFSQLPD